MTLTTRVLAFVRDHPGHTAWEITKAFSRNPNYDKGTVSSLLCRLAEEKGVLQRRKNTKGSWVYYNVR